MKQHEHRRLRNRLGSRLLLMGVALCAWLTPALSSGQTPVVRIVAYEVAEALMFKGAEKAASPEGFVKRMSKATLLGKDVLPLTPPGTPTPFTAGSFIIVDATSNVDLTTGRGPVQGTFKLLTDTDPTRASLDTLVVTASAELRATLDLTTALQGFAGISGRWEIVGQSLEGPFQGVFLIPFKGSAIGLPEPLGDQFWYLNPGPFLGPLAPPCASPIPGLCPLTSEEFALGIPLTKALFVLSR